MFPIFAATNIRIFHNVLDKIRILTSQQRIESFAQLGSYLEKHRSYLASEIQQAQHLNPWFTPKQVESALDAWQDVMQYDKLNAWLTPHLEQLEEVSSLRIGLILAGNIPLVGWHDILTCLISGFKIEVKPSSSDAGLTLRLLEILQEIAPDFSAYIHVVERLEEYDAIIATGSNNSARYFEYYFREVPHIIRKNRNAVAVLHGDESQEVLHTLGKDIFTYFGLGCRNVSKLFVPVGYDFTAFFQAMESYASIGDHHKYRNNYDYYKSIYLVNGDTHLDNGFLLLKEDPQIASPLGVVYYQYYEDLKALEAVLTTEKEAIQCIVGQSLNVPSPLVPFGMAQQPGLNDFADGVSIFEFLKSLKQGK